MQIPKHARVHSHTHAGQHCDMHSLQHACWGDGVTEAEVYVNTLFIYLHCFVWETGKLAKHQVFDEIRRLYNNTEKGSTFFFFDTDVVENSACLIDRAC